MQQPFTVTIKPGGFYEASADVVIYEPSRIGKRITEVREWRGDHYVRAVCGKKVVITRVPPAAFTLNPQFGE